MAMQTMDALIPRIRQQLHPFGNLKVALLEQRKIMLPTVGKRCAENLPRLLVYHHLRFEVMVLLFAGIVPPLFFLAVLPPFPSHQQR